jgi:hypothetical protein
LQHNTVLGVLVAAAALASTAAFAGTIPFHGEAKLTSASAAKQATVAGVAWNCEGDTCSASADRYSSIVSQMKECKGVAAAFGPLSAYKSRGRAMSAGDLSACNKAAPVQTAQTPAPQGN